MWHYLTLTTSISLVVTINSLCSWDRHVNPETGNGNAATMNFVNGEWTLESNTLNGQKVWKKTQTNCYVPTLFLYYWAPDNVGEEYKWLITGSLGSTPGSAYAICQQSPQPTDPTRCFGDWFFAPDGNPTSSLQFYTSDRYFYIKPGDCPQVLCDTLEFTTSGSDDWVGTYTRVGTDVDSNQNKYRSSNSKSSTGEYYLYFNHLMFKWIINEVYDMDCQNTQVNSASAVESWGSSSNIDGAFWYFVPDASLTTRRITCSGKIPTKSPVISDATGYPTGSPTVTSVDCVTFPTHYRCQPTAPTTGPPTQSPSTPTVSWPTYPTVPTEPPLPSKSNGMNCKMYFIVILVLFVAFW